MRGTGRGRALGRAYSCRFPGLLKQALAALRLRQLRYPTPELRLAIWRMGFPVEAKWVKKAWLSCLGKLRHRLNNLAESAAQKQEFAEQEDKISALATPFAKHLSSVFQIDVELIEQPVIDLYWACFYPEFKGEDILLDQLSELVAKLLALDPNASLAGFGLVTFQVVIRWLQARMSLDAVDRIVNEATPNELRQVHRRWRAILSFTKAAIARAFSSEEDAMSLGMLAVGFGRICVPALLSLIREGRALEIDQTIDALSEFASRYSAPDLVRLLHPGSDVDADLTTALRQLVTELSGIWQYEAFPFSLG
jgi:hypothetical protein